MATGRRDYTWGFQSEAATGGRYCESFIPNYTDVVGAQSSKGVYRYTVPASKKLTINSLAITSSSREVIRFEFYVRGSFVLYINFSDYFTFNFSDQNSIIASEGDIIMAWVYNSLDCTVQVWGSIICNLETIS